MKRRGPVLTLLAGVLLASVLAVLNAMGGTSGQQSAAAVGVAVPPLPSASAGQSTGAQPSPPAAVSPSAPRPASPSATASASATAAPARPADYAGRTGDGGASIAVSMQGGKAVAYLCDGNRTEAWLRGTVTGNGTLALDGKDGATLTGAATGRRAAGTVRLSSGRTVSFDVPQVARPAGIYRATGTAAGRKLRAGWVVLPGGRQTGIVDVGGAPSGAPRIPALPGAGGTATVLLDGTALTVLPVTGEGWSEQE